MLSLTYNTTRTTIEMGYECAAKTWEIVQLCDCRESRKHKMVPEHYIVWMHSMSLRHQKISQFPVQKLTHLPYGKQCYFSHCKMLTFSILR